MSERVTLEREGHVLLIGINRPEKRNAFDMEMIRALGKAYELLGDDPELRCGVLFAHGDHFSAGLDLAEVGPVMANEGPAALAGGFTYDPFGVWAKQVPKPVVAAMCGISFTVSIELALASDVVIAAEGCRFRQLEVGRGILPFGGATLRAPRLGWGNAMKFLLTGAEFDSAEALRIGLVQEVVPHGQHVERAKEIAHLIARQAPRGVQATLQNARTMRDRGTDAAREELRDALAGILASEDAAEGVRSFLERREASFTGK